MTDDLTDPDAPRVEADDDKDDDAELARLEALLLEDDEAPSALEAATTAAAEALSARLDALAASGETWDFAWLPSDNNPGLFLLFPEGIDASLVANAAVDGVRVFVGEATYTPEARLRLAVDLLAVEILKPALAAAWGPLLTDFTELEVVDLPDLEPPPSAG